MSTHRVAPSRPGDWRAITALLAVFAATCFIGLSLRSEVPAYGDVGTDERAIVGAEAFVRSGVSRLHRVQTIDSSAAIGLEPNWYYRHPSGGVIVLSWLRRLGWSLQWCRLAPLLATTLGLLGFFLGIRRMAGANIGLLAAFALASAAPFYLLADSFQLYSWAFLVKGAAFWFVARAATRTDGWPIRDAASISLSTLIGVSCCGLETMPAIGLFAALVPLARTDEPWRRRIGISLMMSTGAAIGMALGWLIRLNEIAAVLGQDLGAALEQVVESFKSRAAISDSDGDKKVTGYFGLVSSRFWNTMPAHLSLAAAGIIASFVPVRGDTRLAQAARSLLPWVIATVIAEGAYFILMRQHVFLHRHTSAHFAFAAALAAAWGAIRLAACFGNGIARATAVTASILGLLTFVITGPIETGANLERFGRLHYMERAFANIRRATSLLPERSIVVIPLRAPYDWHFRTILALDGVDFISADTSQRKTVFGSELGRLRSLDRPVFVVTSDSPTDASSKRMQKEGRPFAESTGFVIHAWMNVDPRLFPPRYHRVSKSDLEAGRLTSPDPSLVKQRLAVPRGSGLLLCAPPPALAVPSVWSMPLVAIDPEFCRATCEVSYARIADVEQSAVVASLVAVIEDGDRVESRRCDVTLEPGDSDRHLRVEWSPKVRAVRLEFTARVAAGAGSNRGALVQYSLPVLETIASTER